MLQGKIICVERERKHSGKILTLLNLGRVIEGVNIVLFQLLYVLNFFEIKIKIKFSFIEKKILMIIVPML